MTNQPGNEEQQRYWNEQAGPTWVELQDVLDRQLWPCGAMALSVARPQAGEAVLDVGSGCGATSMEIAQAVGPAGRVVGLDISTPMSELAAQRAVAAGIGNAEFVVADAQSADIPHGKFDLVFSRFGVMFFGDPAAAFANLRAHTNEGGRMTFVCWQSPLDNHWASVPGRAVMSLLPDAPPVDPIAPGPFAFADAERLRALITSGGWKNVHIDNLRFPLRIGGATTLADAVELSMRIGPASRAMIGRPELLDQARAGIHAALEPYYRPSAGVLMDAACWIVHATNS